MTKEIKKDVKALAIEHWEWIQGFIDSLDSFGFDEETLKYIYVTAFIHGYNHGLNPRA